ncbi:hypothetical protein Tco_0938198 [Tanacetum coccineum]|uniref:RNA-directed DNA polymerase, eukaryota, reverse transcriptase zinc-binding domain protein n=1 Tax=Tanacetum coccineum TaxID=301880 RepID=A0ABQ5DHF3_9ASTR
MYALDNKAEEGPLTPTDATARIDIVRELTSLERTKVMDLRQKAKVRWAVDGDENSYFFHGMLNSKLNHSRINGLNILGSWITNPVLIKNHIYQFYESKFKETSNRRPSFTSNLFKHISVEDSNLLDCTITPQEIKDAIWDCGGDKAPAAFLLSSYALTWVSQLGGIYQGVPIGAFLLTSSMRGSVLEENFFWGGLRIRKNCLDLLGQATSPISNGGLGIGTLKSSNLAMLSKWWWRFHTENHAFWCKIIRSIHGVDGGLNDTSLIKYKSGPWYRITKLKDELRKIGIDLPSIFKKRL